jgi:hypothetical protein
MSNEVLQIETQPEEETTKVPKSSSTAAEVQSEMQIQIPSVKPSPLVPEFVKISRAHWDLLVAKFQKVDKQQAAKNQLINDLAKQNKALQQTVREYEKAYLRSERSYAELLRVSGFAIPFPRNSQPTRKQRCDPAKLPDLPYTLPREARENIEMPAKEMSPNNGNVCQESKLNNRDCNVVNAEQAPVPEINVMLRESSRPESWYTSWRMSLKKPEIGVSVSTFQSLAQECFYMKQQMNKLSSQAGFDVQTNLVN